MTSAGTARICVIGIGNEYRGDDAAGLLAARRLKGRGAAVVVLEQSGDATALMDALEGADAAILIDAVQSGSAAGAIHRFEAGTDPLPARHFRCSTHAASLGEAIELARALNRLPPRVVVYGIEAERFDPGAEPSPEVAAAVEETAERALQEIRAIQEGAGE